MFFFCGFNVINEIKLLFYTSNAVCMNNSMHVCVDKVCEIKKNQTSFLFHFISFLVDSKSISIAHIFCLLSLWHTVLQWSF